MPLRVGREKSVAALQKSLRESQWVILLAQRDPEKQVSHQSDLSKVGTLCKVESFRQDEDGSYNIFVKAYERIRIVQMRENDNIFEALSENLVDIVLPDEKTSKALLESLKQLAFEVLDLLPGNLSKIKEWITAVDDLALMANIVASNLDFSISEKQTLLEMVDLKERVLKLLDLLNGTKEGLKVRKDIRERLNENFQASQRENILREQMKVIREELGEGGSDDVLGVYRGKIESAQMPTDAYELAKNQVSRLETINAASPEYQMIRSHLDLMVALPWNKSSTEKEIDLDEAEKILNEDHFGLDKIKTRILQHLAVMKLKKSHQGSILLFVGPPGVGKTSLGKSIARALGKKYVRVSVGGVRDDAEVRGHRRTYVGALPGRIIAGLKKSGENDPVFILDEIDKLSRGFNGDPASALLEVLDPEQNNTFQDHYLDTPFDLSKVFFIATANTLDSIPGPLLDRMEVIDITGYTSEEKKQIALKYLWPKQLAEHSLTRESLEMTDAAMNSLLEHYTREAGVRELQRKIATICKFASLRVVKSKGEKFVVDAGDLEEIFGSEKYSADMIESLLPPGVVTGLAWTPVGGDILFIESAQMPGTGQLVLTGQLGNVMQESACIALTLLKSHLHLIDPLLDFSKKDIHVHVPAGAIPKDGPSAGITMLTSMASLLLHKRVNPKLAMTGEISLRGSVMPVGGIKEKVTAAHRSGVREVILAAKNEKDLKEVSAEVRNEMKFHFVDNVRELLKIALGAEIPDWNQSALSSPGREHAAGDAHS